MFIKAANQGGEGCPGTDNCQKWQSAGDKDSVCAHCKHQRYRPLTDAEFAEARYVRFLEHLFMLKRMMIAGAHFHVDDLTISEWMGLSIIEEALIKSDREGSKQRSPADIAAKKAIEDQWGRFRRSKVFSPERLMPNHKGGKIKTYKGP